MSTIWYWWALSCRHCAWAMAAAVRSRAPLRGCRVSADTASTPVIPTTERMWPAPGAVRLRIQPVSVSWTYRFTTALLRSRTTEKACGAARPATLGWLPHQGQGHGPCLRAEPKAEAVQTVQQRRQVWHKAFPRRPSQHPYRPRHPQPEEPAEAPRVAIIQQQQRSGRLQSQGQDFAFARTQGTRHPP